jgi:hypothetical protein
VHDRRRGPRPPCGPRRERAHHRQVSSRRAGSSSSTRTGTSCPRTDAATETFNTSGRWSRSSRSDWFRCYQRVGIV